MPGAEARRWVENKSQGLESSTRSATCEGKLREMGWDVERGGWMDSVGDLPLGWYGDTEDGGADREDGGVVVLEGWGAALPERIQVVVFRVWRRGCGGSGEGRWRLGCAM